MSGPIRGLLLDLDDTLYEYATPEKLAKANVHQQIAKESRRSVEWIAATWDDSRRAVKDRLGETAASHSRLLYLAELAHHIGADALGRIRDWEEAYWCEFFRAAQLRDGCLDLLKQWRAGSGRVAIVTDLTQDVQLRKLEALGLLPFIDVLVTSEEVLHDKPSPRSIELALTRLDASSQNCIMIGDSEVKDGEAARACGVRFMRVGAGGDDGPTLRQVATEILRSL